MQRPPSTAHDPNALFQRASTLQRAGEIDRAIEIYQFLGANFPRNAATLLLLGIALAQKGNLSEAISCFDDSLTLSPTLAETHYNKGEALRRLGRWREALECYARATQINPDYGLAFYSMGCVCHEQQALSDALNSFDQALRINPGHAGACFRRGVVLGELRDYAAALESLDRAIQIKPDYAEALDSRAAALIQLGRLSEALESSDRAIRLQPENASAHYNRANALQKLGRPEEALVSVDSALRLEPQLAEANWNKSLLKLTVGDLTEGWQLYEWRWRFPEKMARNFSQPLWLGKEPIAGKTVLIYPEQGLGDIIQFCRYVPMVAALGAKVVFEVPAPLVSLMKTLRCDCDVVTADDPLPSFDVQCPIMSLPLAFKTRLETVPAEIPYLAVDREKSAYWAEKIGAAETLRVGLVWSTGHDERKRNIGEQKRRDIPLARLESLNVSGVDFYSLQIGSAAVAELRQLESTHWNGPRITDYTDEIKDFADTAALVANLDLVISVCTSVAHLAGALGKPTWVLLQYSADWRWLLGRSDSPWYSTVTLFRQASFNNWTNVVEEVRGRLIELADNGAKASSS